MTSHPDIFGALAEPFPDREVKTLNKGGKALSYITARSAMNRLDSVLGPECWKDEYAETKDGLKCRIWFRLPGADEWLWKEDGGGFAGMSDSDDDEKSAYSSAFKRACVKLGIGRYLYRDGTADFGDGSHQHAAPRPSAPPPRNGNGHHAPPPSRPQHQDQQGGGQFGNPPRSGRALFAWTKDMEARHDVGLLQYLNRWGKLQDAPGRMVDWDDEMVRLAYEEAVRKLQGTSNDRSAEDRREAAMTNGHDQDPDIPFDHRAAMGHLRAHAAGLAAHIFRPFNGTDAEVDSALQSLDPAVPEHLRVADWSTCTDPASMRAYYAAATTAISDYEHEDVPL